MQNYLELLNYRLAHALWAMVLIQIHGAHTDNACLSLACNISSLHLSFKAIKSQYVELLL